MNRSERDELRRAAVRFQELVQPHKVIAMIERMNELEDSEARRLQTETGKAVDINRYVAPNTVKGNV